MAFKFIKTIEKSQYSQIEDTYVEVSTEGNGSNISELIENFKHFLMACGYHPETVAKYLEPED